MSRDVELWSTFLFKNNIYFSIGFLLTYFFLQIILSIILNEFSIKIYIVYLGITMDA